MLKSIFMPAVAAISLAACAQNTAEAETQPACSVAAEPDTENKLTSAEAAEAAEGWTLLWDGQTSNGWRSLGAETFPTTGWTMCGGILTIHQSDGEESRGGGDIITVKRYSDFEFSFDFRYAPGANSGVKIFAQTDVSPIDRNTGQPVKVGSGIGMEFQVLDDDLHPDAKAGRDGNRTIASFYDVIPASKDKKKLPPGEWNTGRILVKGDQVTYWLNGEKTVEFTRGSPEFRAAVAQSKFKDIPGFGEWVDGHILLQDHGNTVSFKNLKIRDMSGS